ncbi:MAG: hydroxyethylthiazole kinase [Deltaproteobacteria bacterium]|nr:hydroxyethylthiazole kinase [Deltaproteobacteria bacterium]
MTETTRKAGDLLSKLREIRPVIHSITNFVVMNSTANVLLALGAAPIMAHALEEIEDISSISNSLVINIGTLSSAWIESMESAAQLARSSMKPFVLDPVGAGATKLRTKTACNIARFSTPTVIRGNASEILSIARVGSKTRGVDSVNSTDEAIESASMLARSLDTVVAITGEKDFVTDGKRSFVILGGSAMMACVTGTGCAASVIVGAFLAVEKDALLATASALALFKLVAEKASARSAGPGSFWVSVLDELHNVTSEEFSLNARIIFK